MYIKSVVNICPNYAQRNYISSSLAGPKYGGHSTTTTSRHDVNFLKNVRWWTPRIFVTEYALCFVVLKPPVSSMTTKYFDKSRVLMDKTNRICQISLQWRHNDHDGVSNHQPHGCLPNRLFRCRSKKTSKLRVTGLCAGNSPGPVNSLHKVSVTRKMFPFDDAIVF